MNRIYLVRHGENRANLTKEFSFRLVDYPLTEKGRLQAAQTASFFRDKQIHAVYSSPLKRASETAQDIAAALNLPVTILEQFREVNVGLLEQQPPTTEAWEEHNQVIGAWFTGDPERRFPGGENYYELLARMQAGLAQVLDGLQDHNLVIVGHGGIFTFTLPHFCPQVTPEDLRYVENHNCSITEILMHNENGRLQGELIRYAYHQHLSGEAAELVSGLPKQGELKSRKER
jgi:broad specificity phosphatase PhoE